MKVRLIFWNLSPLFLLFSVPEMAQAQSLQSELKKDLWKTIQPYGDKKDRPMNPLTGASNPLRSIETKIPDVMNALYKFKSRMSLDDFYEEYVRTHTVNPQVFTYHGNESLMKVKVGYLRSEFMGGRFQQIPASGNMMPSGIGVDISGGGRKHVSEKTKKILEEVYGREVEE
jgi:hypothetical protein